MARTTFNRAALSLRTIAGDEVERVDGGAAGGASRRAAVGVTTHIPLADERQIGFHPRGGGRDAARWADNASVSGSYFPAMGIPLLRGRTFGEQDAPDAPLAAIVNDSMARRFWPTGEALGKRIEWGGRVLTIVGIAGDVHLAALETAVNPTIYTALYQIDRGPTTQAVFILRGHTASAAAIAPSVRGAIWSVDNGVPVFDVRTMNNVVARSLATRRFTVALLSSFAVLALLLAVVGLYSVLAYGVTQRTPELGVRLALGASPRQLVRLVLGEGLRLTTIGLAVGVAAGVIVARAMTPLLFGVASLDPLAFVDPECFCCSSRWRRAGSRHVGRPTSIPWWRSGMNNLRHSLRRLGSSHSSASRCRGPDARHRCEQRHLLRRQLGPAEETALSESRPHCHFHNGHAVRVRSVGRRRRSSISGSNSPVRLMTCRATAFVSRR